jgi:hypothetical protein
MLFALLRLPSRKWQEYLKELGHRFPLTEGEYKAMQTAIVRESVLGNEIGSLGGLRNLGSHGSKTYMLEDAPDQTTMPLYMCLGQPVAEMATQSTFATFGEHSGFTPSSPPSYQWDGSGTGGAIYSIKDIAADDADDDSSITDSEQFDLEDREDPYSADRLRDEAAAGKDPMYRASVWWAHRQTGRRLKAVRNKFGPRRNFAGRKLGKKFTRRGPLKGKKGDGKDFGKSKSYSKGFFIADTFVSLDHVPDHALEIFFAGGSSGNGGKRNPPKDMRCFNCKKPGHMSASCPSPAMCFECGSTGHRKADCPKLSGSNRAMVIWGGSDDRRLDGQHFMIHELGSSLGTNPYSDGDMAADVDELARNTAEPPAPLPYYTITDHTTPNAVPNDAPTPPPQNDP